MINSIPMRRIKNIHFIGIGGSGMSGIAEVLLNLGYHVSGSDIHPGSITDRLIKLGAKIFTNHSANNIAHTDIIVLSSAINSNNPELLAAIDRSIPIIPRAQMLAELMRFHYGITVAGTHGKTTTTSLVATILSEANLDPTFVIGGVLNSTHTNAKLGKGYYFLAEADESDASFLHFNPMACIVTNIDFDHMTTYNQDPNELKQAFLDFIHRLPFYGLAILCKDDEIVRELIPKISRPIITYGFSQDADVRISEFKQNGLGCNAVINLTKKENTMEMHLNLAGKHNVLNATAAAIIAHECCGVGFDDIANALSKFNGVGRRMQYHGTIHLPKDNKKFILIDDYGHHPREIIVTIEALKTAFPGKRLVLAFQPHRYTRTKSLFEDFIMALILADQLLLMEIYSANEPPIEGINSITLANKIRSSGKLNPTYVKNNEELIAKLPTIIEDGDILLIQGAGNIGSVALTLKTIFNPSLNP